MSNQVTLPDSTSAISSRALAFGVSPCSGPDLEQNRESGRGVALANRGVAPAPAKGQPTNATYGPLFENSYEHAGQPLFSGSKSPVPPLSERLGDALKSRLSRYGSMEYGQTWKLRVTPLGLRYWAHTASGRRTSGSGCTGYQTTSAQMSSSGRKPSGKPNLEGEAQLAGHPTPNACTGGGDQSDPEAALLRMRGRSNLDDAAVLAGHPSPRAEDSEQTGAHRGEPDTLTSCERLAGHATCTTRDHKDGSAESCRNVPENALLGRQCLGANTASTATSTAKTGGYRLNPGFSLWLMIGIPTIVDAWASCGVRAMQSCRRSRRSSLERGWNAATGGKHDPDRNRKRDRPARAVSQHDPARNHGPGQRGTANPAGGEVETMSGKGPVGTQCSGNSRKAAVRRNLWALIKAKDILTAHERRLHEINPNVLDVCRIATETPSLLYERQKRMIWCVWQELAEGNKLHGIRTREEA